MRLFQYILFIAACTCFFAACAKEELPLPLQQQQEEQQVLLAMNVDIATAADDSKTEMPTEVERTLKTLRIYAFTGGKFVGHHYIDNLNTTDAVTLPLNFLMHVTQLSITDQIVDFYVIANEATLRSGQASVTLPDPDKGVIPTEDNLNGFTFSSLAVAEVGGFPNIDKRTYRIDMSKYANVNASTYPDHAGHQVATGITYLKKDNDGKVVEEIAMADGKVSFALQRPTGKLRLYAAAAPGSAATLRIHHAKILNNGTRARNFVMPQPDARLLEMDASVGGTVALLALLSNSASTTTDVHNPVVAREFPAASVGENGAISEEQRTNPDNYTLLHDRAYYPYENPHGSAPEAWMTPTYEADGTTIRGNVLELQYNFNDGVMHTDRVYLPPIRRNNVYNIYCLMNNTGKLTITYNVADWSDAPVWDLEFDTPLYNGLRPVNYTDGNTGFPEPVCWKDQDLNKGAFTAELVFTGPTGQLWNPLLDDATAGEYQIVVYRRSDPSKQLYNTEDLNLRERLYAAADSNNDPFVIKVVPLIGTTTTRTVKLAIAYIPMWELIDASLLLINGQVSGNQTWLNSGTDPQYIEIDHLSADPATNSGTGGQ